MNWHKTVNNMFNNTKKCLEKYKTNTESKLSTVSIRLVLKKSKTIRNMHIELILIMVKHIA